MPPLPDVDDMFEAYTITRVHIQIQDIRSLVPVVLNVSYTHYARWCDLVPLTL
jgi:hypothetical protein